MRKADAARAGSDRVHADACWRRRGVVHGVTRRRGGLSGVRRAGRTASTAGCASVAENQHLRHRERVGVRDGQQRRTAAHRARAPRGAAVQPQLRRPAAAERPRVAPEHAARMAGAERLHRRFLRREAPGEVRHRVAPPRAIGDLAVGEDAAQEPVAVALERAARCAGCRWRRGRGR